MIRQIEEMAKGNMNIERPSNLSYEDNLTFDVYEGQSYEDFFTITNQAQSRFDGDAVCHCCNITSLKTTVTEDGMRVDFVFDAKCLKQGALANGVFHIISNAGEFDIYFMARIVGERLMSPVGEIKNLDEFIKFHAINPNEAAKLYGSRAFPGLLTNTRAKLYYRKLKDVEEFLIAIGAKKRCRFVLDKNKVVFSELLKDEYVENVHINKKTGGSISLEITCDANFIELEKTQIQDEDFIGSTYTLAVKLRRDKLHLGENLGSITISNNFQEEKLLVRAIMAHEIDITKEHYLTEKKKFLQLCRLYESYLAETIVTGQFAKEAIAIADSFSGNDMLFRLVKAYAFIINGQTQEYSWLMNELRPEISGEQVQENMLYHCLLYIGENDSDYRERLFTKIVDIYQKNMASSFVRYCMLLIDAEALDSKSKLVMIVKWIKEGENSPFFFGYACRLLNEYPFFLTDLKREMLIILNWGCKRGFIGRALTEQILSLYQTSGSYQVILDRILTRCQAKYPTRDTLTAVCAYRIKGELIRSIDHLWYKKAIDEDIKLGGLYEYYIASMEKGVVERLPGQVGIYFQYNNYLSRKQKAVLYVNIVAYKEQDPETYETYRRSIREFVEGELHAGHIDDNLSVLYNEFFDEVTMDEELYDALSRIVYVNRLICLNRKARYVYIIHENLSEIKAYSLADGVAYVPILPGEYVYVMADGTGALFVDNDACEQERLFNPAKMMRKALEAGSLKIPYILHHMMGKQSLQGLSDTEVAYLRALMESPEISASYKKKIASAIVRYHKGSYGSDELIRQMDVRDLDETARPVYIEGLIGECVFDKAYEFVDFYGPDAVSLPALEQVIMYCLTYIREYDEALCKLMVYAAASGSRRQIIYRYLSVYMQGTEDELYSVWEQALALSVDVRAMTEKQLLLMMFTGEIKHYARKLFSHYVALGGEGLIRRAYANYFAYSYITRCTAPSEEAFAYLLAHINTEELPQYAKISLLKFLSCKQKLNPKEEAAVDDILTELLADGIYFGFYKNLPKAVQVRFHLYDKYIITIKSAAEELSLYYRLDDEKMQRGVLDHTFYDYHTFTQNALGSQKLYYYVDEAGDRFLSRGGFKMVRGVSDGLDNRYAMLAKGKPAMALRAMDMTVEKLFLPI